MRVRQSVNIINDAAGPIDYQVTANAKRTFNSLWQGYRDGIRAFNVIGSYGSGKSAFLWALQSDLKGSSHFFDVEAPSQFEYIPIVGDAVSLIEHLAKTLDCEAEDQAIFKALKQKSKAAGNSGLVLLQLDEMGKHLEHAANNNPEAEIYFMQKLAELTNRQGSNLLLVTTLHQSFDAYANRLTQATRKEWEKVKGRFKELSFNESPEALLEIGATHIEAQHAFTWSAEDEAILNSKVLLVDQTLYSDLAARLYPLDVLTGKCLTQAFQRYGQNNRSLFTFLNSTDQGALTDWQELNKGYYHLEVAFDYLLNTFYHYLTTSGNKDYLAWTSLLNGLDRIDAQLPQAQIPLAKQCLKVIGMMRLFSPKGYKLNREVLKAYFNKYLGMADAKVEKALNALEKAQIIRFRKFEEAFALVEGTDIDIDNELMTVGNRLSKQEDIVGALTKRIQFDPIAARRISFTSGTPRFFELLPSEEPYLKAPKGEVDGIINLIFNSETTAAAIQEVSAQCEHAIVFAYFTQTDRINETLHEIDKIEQLLIDHEEDKAAVRELKKIKEHQENLLKLFVEDGLTGPKVAWYFKGQKLPIRSRKALNQKLSEVIEQVYPLCPVYRNELINRQKLSGSIGAARKAFFNALAADWEEEHLGFAESKFPPEKTIFLSLLKHTGIQNCANSGVFQTPVSESFLPLWQAGLNFIKQATTERMKVTELFDTLQKAPYGIKYGFLEVWIPTFLFIHRAEFALYEKDKGFQPEVNGGVLNLLSRNPKDFEIKSFDLGEARLLIFNRYREFLQLGQKKRLDNVGFIESIKPFLVFYKGLNAYAKKTKRLPPETLAFRKAIEHAKDPEEVFFGSFPKALGFTEDDLESTEALEQFTAKLGACSKELNGAYNALLNRLEAALQDVLFSKDADFQQLQTILGQRYDGIQERFLTLMQKQFLARVKTPIGDRDSWYAAIFQPLAGKPLHTISDAEEYILVNRISHIIKEIDNMVKIQAAGKDDTVELIKLDLTFGSALKEQVVRVPIQPNKAFSAKEAALKKLLKDKPEWNLALLAKLLKEEFENDKS